MRRFPLCGRTTALAAVLWFFLASPALAATLYQVGAIASLLAGDYAGRENFAELGRNGDCGLGTFANLDGEMAALDGIFYQIRSDGSVRRVEPGEKTPFAQVAFLRGRLDCGSVDGMDLPAMTKAFAAHLPDPGRLAMVRVDGEFEAVTTRSVPAQTKPLPPLATAIEHQAVFPLGHVRGTLIGIYTPPGMDMLSAPGWHFHFLSADRRHGGHVLSAKALTGKARGESFDQLHVLFPAGPAPRTAAPRPAAGAE